MLLTYGFAQADYPPFAREYLDWLSDLDRDDETRLAGVELAGAAVLELERPQPEVRRRQADRLLAALTDLTLKASPVTRARAGDTLARLGDSRFNADRWGLPDEPLLGFVEIPEGPFLMGSDKRRDKDSIDREWPQHEVFLPTYYMARYPITVDQFRAFVNDSGYTPRDEDSLRGVSTHPVVNVAWYNALAYCEWLTNKLQAIANQRIGESANQREQLTFWHGLRDGTLHVTLPSEAEWEKAGRDADGRIFPWGNEFDRDKANADLNVGRTSAVGCFPNGKSPYGMLDMSGNVWEWTRSLWGQDYPHRSGKDREDLQAPREVRRVLRGGAFVGYRGYARCAYRSWGDPDVRYGGVGCRLVVSPF